MTAPTRPGGARECGARIVAHMLAVRRACIADVAHDLGHDVETVREWLHAPADAGALLRERENATVGPGRLWFEVVG